AVPKRVEEVVAPVDAGVEEEPDPFTDERHAAETGVVGHVLEVDAIDDRLDLGCPVACGHQCGHYRSGGGAGQVDELVAGLLDHTQSPDQANAPDPAAREAPVQLFGHLSPPPTEVLPGRRAYEA